VDFFEDAERARTYSDGQNTYLAGATGGSSEVTGETVVIAAAGPGAEAPIAQVKGCIGR
jgi:hypothetical protein